MIRASLLAAALVASFLGACRTAGPADALASFPAPREQLDQAQRAAETSQLPAQLGRAALAAYVLTGNPERAESWAARALAKDSKQPAALYARVLIAREALDETGVVKGALAILRGAPASDFAELAASRLQEVTQVSPAADKLISDALSGLDTSSMGLSGRAAQRAREALIAVRDAANEEALATTTRAAAAVVPAWTVVGPLQALRLRDFPKPSPFDDPKHVLAASYTGPAGAVVPRVLPTPSGALDLDAESWRSDVFEALTDVTVTSGGTYLVAMRGLNQATLLVDGVEVVRRTAYPQRSPERTWGGVELSPGKHRLRVRLARVDVGWLAVSVSRADGAPADLVFHPPTVGEVPPAATARRVEGAALTSVASLELPAVDLFLRVQRELSNDGEQARADTDALITTAGENAVTRGLRMDLTAADPDVPRPTIVARVMKDLDAILSEQPRDARAIVGRFEQENGDKRYDEAAARLDKLAAVVGAQHPRVLMLRARFANERGDMASARKFTDAALAADPGRCEALDFRSDLARRDGETRVVDTLVPQLLHCPGGLAANVSYLRAHLKLAQSKPLLERLVARSPTSPAARRALSDALFALDDTKGAEAVLEPLEAMWPQRNDALKRLSVLHELSGDHAGAAELLKRALVIDHSDLMLARAVALESHADVVAWATRDGQAVIAAYKQAHFETTAPAVQVLDYEAVDVAMDGSSTSRAHSIVQVLDKRGIDRYGEVSLPPDAQPVLLRTVKADGTILDAEVIGGKESVSLPNLEPGDFVEYSYVRASGARPSAMPGWQGGQFIFQGDDAPFFESTYEVHVPASLGIEFDMQALPVPPKVERHGDTLTLTYSRKGVQPYLREPMSPSDAEILPWIEVGTGATQADVVRQFSDWFVLRARVNNAVAEFVRGMDRLPVAERAEAIVNKLRNQVRGDSNAFDFSETGAGAIAQGRGNRLLALKVSLAAAGIPSHMVIVRPFSNNSHAFRFPRADLYSSALLRIEPPGQPVMWMDFGLRQAPFNRIPQTLSAADAYTVPEPGEETEHFTMPTVAPELDRTDADMQLALAADGTLTGTITQAAYGFDAAALRRRLEQANHSQLVKQQERSLGATFRGVVLVDLKVSDSGDPDRPLTAVSTIQVPRFGQRADGTAALPANFGAAQMGPRFITRAERLTPMLIAVDDLSRAHVTIALPPHLAPRLPAPVDLQSPFGHFKAAWGLVGGTLTYQEELVLNHGRIAPTQYSDFKAFAATIDSAQQREIPLAAL